MTQPPQIAPVRAYCLALQQAICPRLEALDGTAHFRGDDVASANGALARPRVLEDGLHIEKAAVQWDEELVVG